MEKFYRFIDSALPDRNGNKVLYKFKRETIDDMTKRANELTARGLKDNDVISDLIIDEYSGIVDDYQKYEYEKRQKEFRKKFAIGNVIGSIVYIITLIVCFLGIGFATHIWSPTWVIIVDGILLWVSYLLTIGVARIIEMKRIFHIIARIMLGMDIVVMAVSVFIFMMAVLHIPNSWVVILGGILAMFLADAVFATVTRQKLAIISWLAYIPAMSAMLYIILAGLSVVSWVGGWVLIPLSLIIDLIIIIVAVRVNTGYKEEVVDAWKEN